jgi:hypothetical protein
MRSQLNSVNSRVRAAGSMHRGSGRENLGKRFLNSLLDRDVVLLALPPAIASAIEAQLQS